MTYLVAVSGGIDSVVLLDMLARFKQNKLIVAHFDHGIRSDSGNDARFVEGLARQYQLPFVSRREELGERASEELARIRRYAFLRAEAKKHDAVIVTAHHANDIIESIAINLQRGTGWRGLAVLNSRDILRPLLGFTKDELRDYALINRLEWVEDSTNASDRYLRNRLRAILGKALSVQEQREIQLLRTKQIKLKTAIDQEVSKHITGFNGAAYSRHLFIMIAPLPAQELLQAIAVRATGKTLLRPQLDRGLLAIKTALPAKVCILSAGVQLRFTRRTFIVETF